MPKALGVQRSRVRIEFRRSRWDGEHDSETTTVEAPIANDQLAISLARAKLDVPPARFVRGEVL